MNTIKILDATPTDAEDILEVRQKTWLATYPNKEYGITVADIQAKDFTGPTRLERWRKTLEVQSPINHGWVAKNNGVTVGFCIVGHTNNQGEIKSIYILPEYQGKGIGKQFMSKALKWLGTEKEVFVNVAKYNTASIEFYQSFGFEVKKEIEPSPASKLPSGKIIPEIQLVRALKSK